MTRILTALTLAAALGLSMASASIAGGYMEAGSITSQNPALPIDTSTGK